MYGSDSENQIASLGSSRFGVGFYAPVDSHRMSERALKYELFVIILTFLVFAMFEIFSRLRIHSIQYLLVGAALALFYLLLLSLSEHVGFAGAYVVASALVIALVAGYSRSVLKRGSGAAITGFSLSLLYGFFFTLLQEQDFSLLIGSLGLTAILGVVMYLTRNIDWYGVGREELEATA
jgi:inner membrane protein